MKKNVIVGITLALGMLSVGALSASAADTCGKCADQQAVMQFQQETDTLARELKTKNIELRELYGFEGIDLSRVGTLETEIKNLKTKINASASKYRIPACSQS
jgi:peptidoglycan hydrolase CwlO-like protein